MRKEKIEMFHRCIYCFAPMEELPDREEQEEQGLRELLRAGQTLFPTAILQSEC